MIQTIRWIECPHGRRLSQTIGCCWSKFIRQRRIGHLAKADPTYGAGAAQRLGLRAKEVAAE
jgi:hypothetical protein